MKIKLLLIMFILLGTYGIFAQQTFPPDELIIGTFIGKTMPLRDYQTIVDNPNMEPNELRIVPNGSRYNALVNKNALPQGMDPLVQRSMGTIQTRDLEQNFIGASSSESGAVPPDPTGAVGPNHYVHSVNSIVKIFDKTGNLLVGPVSLGTFLGIGTSGGDPIVLYDQLADRYFVSEFGSLNNSLAIGVSETNDPTGAYNVYQFTFDSFPDYPHYAVWPDAYYLTANKGGTNKVYAIERSVILAGGTNPKIVGFPLPGGVQNTNTVLSPEPANILGTTFPPNLPGYITYLQDDGWSGVSFDHLKVWEIDVDFANTSNSTISAPLEIPTAPFNSVFAPFGSGDVGQPGTSQKIDMIGGVISFGANYRSFGDHNSWVITFNTDIDGNDTSGIRWIELRNDVSNPWTIYQEGTYAPADGKSRFMSSSAIDGAGNIGIAFNIASSTMPVGIRYTGRFEGDPLGQMTVAETTIIDGVGVQTFTNRFGDYAHLTMDPNNFTFWHTAEYFSTTNNWRTRIASFSISGGFANDVGVNAIPAPNNGVFTNAESVTISIRNYGTNPQVNIPVQLFLDGNFVASEIYTGTLNANETVTYTFAQTVDLSNPGQTYVLEANTLLVGDEFAGNDAFTKSVIHLLNNDVGVIAITNPDPVINIGVETVTITIKNFGVNTQINTPVQYTINGGTPVLENFVGPILSEEEVTYNFTQQADLTTPGTYTLESRTNLVGDQDPTNDSSGIQIIASSCMPMSDCAGFNDGVTRIDWADQNIETNCTGSGYSDDTSIVFNFDLTNNNPFAGTIQVGFSNSNYAIWIDFNDSGTFESSEILSEGLVNSANSDFPFSVDFSSIPGVTEGLHLMRVRGGDVQNGSGDVLDPCGDLQYGRTNDYTANVIGTLSVEEQAIAQSNLLVTTLANKQFEITLTSNYEGNVYFGIYNMLGQQMGVRLIPREGANKFTLKLDMSSASSGVYLVKVGGQTTRTFKTAKIIVK